MTKIKLGLGVLVMLGLAQSVWAISDEQLNGVAERREAQKQAQDSNSKLKGPKLLRTKSGKISIVTEHKINIPGRNLKVEATRGLNENGIPQVSYDVTEYPLVGWPVKATLLYGRDLDSDGKMDAWFWFKQPGVPTSLEREAVTAGDGWDVAEDLLINKVRLEKRVYAWLAVDSIFSTFTLSGGVSNFYFQDIQKKQINLLEAEIRANRLWAQGSNSEALLLFSLIDRGWKEVSQEVDGSSYQTNLLLCLDAVLGGFIERIGQGIWGGLSWTANKVTPGPVKAWAAQVATNITHASKAAAQQALDRLSMRKDVQVALAKTLGLTKKVTGAVAFQALKVSEQVNAALVAMQQRSFLERTAANLLIKGGNIVGHGLKEADYIGTVLSTLVVAEVAVHGDSSKAGDPVVYVKDAVSEEEFRQSLLFMTSETFLQTAITASSNNVRGRMIATAFVSAGDSTFWGINIKHTTDPQRLAIDTSWQALVGNAQTNVDLAAMNYFREAALKAQNPKIKVLGYAFVVVNQGLGFLGYEWTVKHAPGMMDQLQKKISAQKNPSATQELKVKLIPIVTEE